MSDDPKKLSEDAKNPLETRNCEHCSHGRHVESWEFDEPGCADTELSLKGLPGYDPRNAEYYPGPDCPLRTIAKLRSLLSEVKTSIGEKRMIDLMRDGDEPGLLARIDEALNDE